MSLRLVYVVFVRLCGWLVLAGRSSVSNYAELLVLRDEIAVLLSAELAALIARLAAENNG